MSEQPHRAPADSAKKITSVTLAVVAAALGVWGWREHRQTEALRAELAALNAGPGATGGKQNLVSAQGAEVAKPAGAADDMNGVGAVEGKTRREKKLERAAGTTDPKDKERKRQAQTELAGNPEYEKLTAAKARAEVDRIYGLMFLSLKLPPETQARLQELLAERQQTMDDATGAARENGLKPRKVPDGFGQAAGQAALPVDAQIRELVGDAAFGEIQQYQNSIPERKLVSQLQAQLFATSSPLADEQATKLVELLTQAKSAPPANPASAGAKPNRNDKVAMLDTTLTVAQQVLTSAQVQVLDQIRQQQTNQREFNRLVKGKPAKPPVP